MEEGIERRNKLTGMLENFQSSRASAVQDSTALFQAKNDSGGDVAPSAAEALASTSAVGRAAGEVVVYVRDVHYHTGSTAYRYRRPVTPSFARSLRM